MGLFEIYPVLLVFVIVLVPNVDNYIPATHPYEVIFSWKYFDFNFPIPGIRERMLKRGDYVPQNITVTGIKIFGSRMFLALPRSRLGVPSTLNVVYFDQTLNGLGKIGTGPLLEPYPSWEMQQIGNCRGIQFAQSMEIDEFGRMWVFDVGRVNILAEDPSEHKNYCPAKLLVFDLRTDTIVAAHVFPNEVVSRNSNFLNDLVVGCEHPIDKSRCWAYFTEQNDVKLVVYSLEQNRSWFVRNNWTMEANPFQSDFNILGRRYNFTLNIDGIALSPKTAGHDRVYYAPTSSHSLYSVPTSILKSAHNGYKLKKYQISTLTRRRGSQSDGMMMDSDGHLFYGALQNNLVAYVDTFLGDFKKEMMLVGNDEELQWPDAFAFDNKGYLYLISIRLQRYLSNTINLADVNYRVVRVYTGTTSYVYYSKRAHSSLHNSHPEPPGYYHGVSVKSSKYPFYFHVSKASNYFYYR